MPPQRTPIQEAWLTLDIVASRLDRTAYRRTHMPWVEMNLLATKVREAREVFMVELTGDNKPPG
ncbi:hypothetical protein [Nocardia sp. NPDC049707]|uniref:hypothetical protein n=1 Tax=Nocardia sp. NPDC049707 TaxID=3154735 RepID=UPI00342CD4B2